MKRITIITIVTLLVIATALYLYSNGQEDIDTNGSSLAPLYAYQWQLQDVNSENMSGEPQDMSDFVITFNANNRFNATTDCNTVGGEYSVQNGTELTFGLMEATEMECLQETFQLEFMALLDRTQSYSVAELASDEPQLTLALSDGEMIFVGAWENIPSPTDMDPEASIDLDDFVGMEEEEAVRYAAENDVMFRVGERDGEFLPVTMDYRVGRVTASVQNGVVTGFTVE